MCHYSWARGELAIDLHIDHLVPHILLSAPSVWQKPYHLLVITVHYSRQDYNFLLAGLWAQRA